MRIVVAMSGGVDSSVAAALLAREGHDVIGLSMQLYDQSRRRDRSSAAAARSTICYDARRVATAIGIPALHRQLRAQVRGARRFGLRARVRGRADADPLRALQRRPEVRLARGARGELRRRGGRHRPLRAGGLRRGDAALPAEARRRRAEGPVVLPVHADPGAARARALSRRRARQGRRPRRGAPARPARRGQEGQPGDLLRRLPASTPTSSASRADDAGRGDPRPRGARPRPARGRPPLHHRAAQGPRPLVRNPALRGRHRRRERRGHRRPARGSRARRRSQHRA